MSPLTKALQKRFEEISRSELQRLRKKTAGLEPDARAAVDAFTVEVMHAIAARATERLQGPDSDRLATTLARLFGVNERVGSLGPSSAQN